MVLGAAESVGTVVSRGFCGECVAAHVGRACEALPGACEICDDCAACAVMSPDDRVSAGWQCGACGVDFAHGDGVHDVQYGIYHEFTCHGCADGGAA